MKSCNIIKDICSRLGLSQGEMTEKLGTSFTKVNRWEKDRCEPSKIAMKVIRRLCSYNNIAFSPYEDNIRLVSDNMLRLNENV